MGTRHLITIVADGEFKLAQYGQWDGYPSGQGLKILEFLSAGEGNIEGLRRNVGQLHFVDQKEADALYKTVGISAGQRWINIDQSDALKKALPSLHRDTGADILDLIARGRVNYEKPKETITFERWLFEGNPRIPTFNSIEFAGEFGCEWAYAIDLDNDTLEVYEGRCEIEGERTRFTELIKKAYQGSGETPHFPRMVGQYKLDALPSWEQFLGELQPQAIERVRTWMTAKNEEAAEEASAAPDSDADGDKPIWSA
jgi:hypothetical protein